MSSSIEMRRSYEEQDHQMAAALARSSHGSGAAAVSPRLPPVHESVDAGDGGGRYQAVGSFDEPGASSSSGGGGCRTGGDDTPDTRRELRRCVPAARHPLPRLSFCWPAVVISTVTAPPPRGTANRRGRRRCNSAAAGCGCWAVP